METKNIVPVLVAIGLFGAGIAAAQPFFAPHEESGVTAAIANNDFNAWKSAMESQLTQENFDKLVSRYSQMGTMQKNRMAAEDAVANNDYAAWHNAVTASGNYPAWIDKINEGNFAQFVEMHNAMKNGDFATASDIASQLGIENFGRRGAGHFGGMHDHW